MELKPDKLQRLFDSILGYDCFISYAWVDGDIFSQKLYDRLNSHYRACLDRYDFHGGLSISLRTRQLIKKSSAFVVLLTPGAYQSQAVKEEIIHAIECKKLIIPVVIYPDNWQVDGNCNLETLLGDRRRIRETEDDEKKIPSAEVVLELEKGFTFIKQQSIRAWGLLSITLLMTLLAAAAIIFAVQAVKQQNKTEKLLEATLIQKLAARSEVIFKQSPDLAFLLNHEAWRRGKRLKLDLTLEDNSDEEVHNQLHRGLYDSKVSLFKNILAKGPLIKHIYSNSAAINNVAVDQNESFLVVSTDDQILIWDLESDEFYCELTMPNIATEVAINQAGNLVAASSELGIYLWHIQESCEQRQLVPLELAHAMNFSRSGGRLAVGTSNGFVHILDLKMTTQNKKWQVKTFNQALSGAILSIP